jgi:hypothetical protein
MFWSLLTAFVAAFAGAGVGLALRHMSRKRLPNGIIPVCAGIAMIVATVASEYQWAPNVIRTMAPDTVVVSERTQQSWYQPWTYVSPWVRGFISYSPAEVAETAEGSGILVVQLRRQERWQPQMVLPNLVDCDGMRRAEILPETEFDDTGSPTNALWREVSDDDPILGTVCAGEAPTG